MKLDLNKIKKVYLSGVGGIGLSGLAYYFLNLKKEVEGSDVNLSEVTKRLEDKGVYINQKQKANNITADIDLFIYTSALPANHPELKQAQKLKIPTMSYFQFLGYLSTQYKTIAVAGTNGKTTTTAMLGLILEKAGLDLTVIVGSLVPQWHSNFRAGQSDLLVIEACEWQAHMLEIDPQVIVLTNIAEDHLDFYKDLADIKQHFQKFVNKLPADGLLIKNQADANSAEIKFSGKTLTFGNDTQADFSFANLTVKPGKQNFIVKKNDKQIGNFDLKIPGLYNVYNALAATAAADYLQVNKHQIWNSLQEFNNTWRRFEVVGQYKSNIVISDYAHHPDSIKELLQATKDFYPDKNIVSIFQPHHHNRTKTLLNDFATSFTLADEVIVSEIYQVSGREDEKHEDISSQDLVDKIDQQKVYYATDFAEVKKRLRKINPTDAVLLFIGAGDIDDLARELTR